jgi:hypothetical protein
MLFGDIRLQNALIFYRDGYTMQIHFMKVVGVAAVAAAAVAASMFFYMQQTIYLVAFALAGFLVGAYVLLMARIFGIKAGVNTLLSCWIVVLVAMSAGEWYLRHTPDADGDVSPGLLPFAVQTFVNWKRADSNRPWANDDFGMRVQDAVTVHDLSLVINKQSCNVRSFNLLRIFTRGPLPLANDLETMKSTYTGSLNLTDVNERWKLRLKIDEGELRNFEGALREGRDVLAHTSEPDKGALLRRFTDAQNSVIEAYRARNAIWAPELAAVQALIDEQTKVSAAGTITEEDDRTWNELVKKYQDVQAAQQKAKMPDFKAVMTQYYRTIQVLLRIPPGDARITPVPESCGYPLEGANGVDAFGMRKLVNEADQLNDVWTMPASP